MLLGTYGSLATARQNNQDLAYCNSKFITVLDTTGEMIEVLAEALPHLNKATTESEIYGWDDEAIADFNRFVKGWNEADELSQQAANQAQDPKCFENEPAQTL